jgi:hypothetical protein
VRSAACSLLLLLPGAFFFPMGYVRSVLLLLAGSAAWSSARLGSARARHLRLLRARLAPHWRRSNPRGKSPGPLGAQQPSPVLERAAFNVASHHTYTILGSVLLVLLDAVVVLPLLHATLRPRQRVQTAAPAAPRVDTPLVPTPKMQHAQSAREGVSYNTV